MGIKTFLAGLLVMATTIGAEASWLQIGEQALNIQRGSVLVTVVGIEFNGTYVIQYEEGPLTGQRGGNWSPYDLARLQGCTIDGLCVGEQGFNMSRDTARVSVVGIQADQTSVVLRYLNGSLQGQRGGNWKSSDIALTRGCGLHFCVGVQALNRSRNYATVEILGIHRARGTYVLLFKDGDLRGQIGGNWSDFDLVRVRP